MLNNAPCPIIGFIGESGSGKTTLISALITILKGYGLRVTAIKHSHHRFDVDHPGKDSHTLRQSGANQVLVASKRRWALMVENEINQPEPMLDELLRYIAPKSADIIIVEGFKHEAFPKLLVHRQAAAAAPLPAWDTDILGVVTDVLHEVPQDKILLDINQPPQVAEYLIQHFRLKTGT
jgi:molybdopterin-guanine dinucleotide biosynthesis protein MobB